MKQYNVTGMSCAACSARIEKAVSAISGVNQCNVNLLTNTMTVDGTATAQEIITAVQKAGYGAELQENNKADILEKLGLPKYDSYYYIERLRLIDDKPFMLNRSFIPAKFINRSLAKDPNNYHSIYETLQKDKQLYLFDEPFTETDTIVQADDEISQKLKIAKDYPVVRKVKKTILSATHEVAELVIGYKRCDYFSLSFSSTNYPEV